ncbi:hypothetical protein DAI22_09g179900 [Oryza sativa Japonica Group]|nr:hypothetical protein DAI22_09g179900 [Oryza sativa Japonica Group]
MPCCAPAFRQTPDGPISHSPPPLPSTRERRRRIHPQPPRLHSSPRHMPRRPSDRRRRRERPPRPATREREGENARMAASRRNEIKSNMTPPTIARTRPEGLGVKWAGIIWPADPAREVSNG